MPSRVSEAAFRSCQSCRMTVAWDEKGLAELSVKVPLSLRPKNSPIYRTYQGFGQPYLNMKVLLELQANLFDTPHLPL